jgi:hypothetical protein
MKIEANVNLVCLILAKLLALLFMRIGYVIRTFHLD